MTRPGEPLEPDRDNRAPLPAEDNENAAAPPLARDGGSYVALSVALPILAAFAGGVAVFFGTRAAISERLTRLESTVKLDLPVQRLVQESFVYRTLNDLYVLEGVAVALDKDVSRWQKPEFELTDESAPPEWPYEWKKEFKWIADIKAGTHPEVIDTQTYASVIAFGSFAVIEDPDLVRDLYRVGDLLREYNDAVVEFCNLPSTGSRWGERRPRVTPGRPARDLDKFLEQANNSMVELKGIVSALPGRLQQARSKLQARMSSQEG